MMDYKHLEALAAVINENGFEKASKKLNITQSAVSQRIKQLEDLTGQILIIRKSPPRPTNYGKKLLKHFMLVEKLETELLNGIHENKEQEFLNIAIGLNADSLATWFIDSCSNFLETHKVTMDLRIDDQDETHIMLKNGEVLGCIGSKKLSIQGCCSTFLGNMKYRPDVMESDDHNAIYQYLKEIQAENPSLTGIGVFNPDGGNIAKIGFQNIETINNFPGEIKALFQTILSSAQGDVLVSEATFLNGNESIIIFTPITDDSNVKVIRTILIHIDLEPVKQLVANFDDTIIGDKFVYIADNDGKVIITPDSNLEKFGRLPDLKTNPNLLDALGDEHGYMRFTDSIGDDVIAGYVDMAEFGKNNALDWSMIATAPVKDILKPAYVLARIIIILSLITIIAVAIISFLIGKNISSPIIKMTETLKDISEGEGDLTARIDLKSRDELGLMANFFNQFVKKLHATISNLTENISELTDSTQELSSISGSMSASAKQMTDKSETVAVAAEKMSSTMTSVSAAAEQSSSNINMVSDSAKEMTSTINEIALSTEKTSQSSNHAVTRTQEASSNIEKLSHEAQEIGRVLETINDISEQTNLLALNATIEAARAGDAGKGFAVVAGEIKDLARQTAEATFEIKERVNGIQNSTSLTVSAIEEIISEINRVNQMISTVASAVEEQSATTQEIASNVSQAALGIDDATENVSQTSSVAAEISQDIVMVDNSAKDILNSSSMVDSSVNNLTQLSEKLSKLVGQFKI